MDKWCLDPKFLTAETYSKYIKSFAFVWKSGGLMQNPELRIDIDKMYDNKGQLISKEKFALFNYSKKQT